MISDDGSVEPMDVPPPRQEFVDQLEYRLRAMHVEADPSTSRRWSRAVVLVPAFAVLVVVLLIGSIIATSGDDEAFALVLDEAENVSVTLPDGAVLTDPVGIVLPEGSVIEIGEGGRAVTSDGDVYDGGVIVDVESDRAVVRPSTTTVPEAPTSTRPIDASTTTVARPPPTVVDDPERPPTTTQARPDVSDRPSTTTTEAARDEPPSDGANDRDGDDDRDAEVGDGRRGDSEGVDSGADVLGAGLERADAAP